MSNTIPFCFLDEAKTEDISKLSIADLLSLQARLNSVLAEAKRHKTILDNALELKTSHRRHPYIHQTPDLELLTGLPSGEQLLR